MVSRKLYKQFLLVMTTFIVVTLFLHHLHKNFRGSKDKSPLDRPLPTLRSRDTLLWPASQYDILAGRARNNLPLVWNAYSGSDRIEEQMEFVPDKTGSGGGVGRLLNIFVPLGSFDVPYGRDVFTTCDVSSCLLVNAEGTGVAPIDLRLFNLQISYTEAMEYMSKRNEDEIWVLYALEGPLASPDFFMLDGVFNWTATYRLDSTIVTPYERWRPHRAQDIDHSQSGKVKNYAKGKTRKAAIFVSNCETTNGRLQYVQELKRYIDVDVYGACGDGTFNCDRFTNEQGCLDLLKRDYKFYLAFENSNCRHYITEKFFKNALQNNALPIVMGAHPDDYHRVAPPGSYIHVDDFSSPRQLADYLLTLDNNDTLYNTYFHWKGTGDFINTKFWCRLCALLSDPNKPELIMDSLSNWWRAPGVCIRADQKWK